MAAAKMVQFSLKVMMIKERNKVLYAEVDSDFADVLLSFLTLPLGTTVRLLIKHYGNKVPILGSLNSLYAGLLNLDRSHFWTESGKLMLLNPRNSSGIQCSRLKLQIDDTPPIQYFICGYSTKCLSMYGSVKCLCQIQNSTNIQIARKDVEIEAQSVDKGVFTTQTASFLLTEDLQILANSSASFFRLLELNGIEDTSVLEERTLVVGLKEIMELLKRSLVSKTPVTDIILSISSVAATVINRNFLSSAQNDSDALPQTVTQTSKNISPNSKKFNVRVLVQKSTNRILLAQTWQDFIDFLFSLLTIPLGRVQHLLGNNTTCLGSIGNLYRSISNSETVKYIKSMETISRLLQPQLPPYYLSNYQIFPLSEQSCSPLLCKRDDKNFYKLFVCTSIHPEAMKIIDPKGQGSFVKAPKMFMVTDDLTVSTPPSTSIFSTLNKLKIPPSDVEEQELAIGMEEALSILKASLTSTCALSEGLKPFLKRQPKQEQ